MRFKALTLICLLSLAAACGGTDDDTETPAAPDTTAPPETTAPPPTEAPDPVDEGPGPVFDEAVEFIIRESYPMQVAVEVSGSLPTPCHEPAWELKKSPPVYEISVWSVDGSEGEGCAAVLEPFTEVIELEDPFEFADYMVVVNGKEHPLLLGPAEEEQPASGEDQLVPGDDAPVYIDDVLFVVREKDPPSVAVEISGSLPTPCHELQWEVSEGDFRFDISLRAVDTSDGGACAAVLEPFTQLVELGDSVPYGDYIVTVNGQEHPLSL